MVMIGGRGKKWVSLDGPFVLDGLTSICSRLKELGGTLTMSCITANWNIVASQSSTRLNQQHHDETEGQFGGHTKPAAPLAGSVVQGEEAPTRIRGGGPSKPPKYISAIAWLVWHQREEPAPQFPLHGSDQGKSATRALHSSTVCPITRGVDLMTWLLLVRMPCQPGEGLQAIHHIHVLFTPPPIKHHIYERLGILGQGSSPPSSHGLPAAKARGLPRD